MIDLTPAEAHKAKQLQTLLLSDGRDKHIPERIVQILMGKFRAPFAEVEKAIRLTLLLPTKTSPLEVLKTQAFRNGRCILGDQEASSSYNGRHLRGNDGYFLPNYDRAEDWFNHLESAQARDILQKISSRLQQLEQDVASEDPLSYGNGRILLLWWYDFCHDSRKQAFYQAYIRKELATPESIRKYFFPRRRHKDVSHVTSS